jgi:hypothetical protein
MGRSAHAFSTTARRPIPRVRATPCASHTRKTPIRRQGQHTVAGRTTPPSCTRRGPRKKHLLSSSRCLIAACCPPSISAFEQFRLYLEHQHYDRPRGRTALAGSSDPKKRRVSVCTRFPFPRWGFLDGDKLKAPGLCALNGSKRDRRIEGGEPSLIRQRRREQINLRKLAMALDVLPSKAAGFPHTHRIRPEDVLPVGAESSQSSRSVLHGSAGAGIGWVRQHTLGRHSQSAHTSPIDVCN